MGEILGQPHDLYLRYGYPVVHKSLKQLHTAHKMQAWAWTIKAVIQKLIPGGSVVEELNGRRTLATKTCPGRNCACPVGCWLQVALQADLYRIGPRHLR